jgi:hypothetical protein
MKKNERNDFNELVKIAAKRMHRSEAYLRNVIRKGTPCEATARQLAPLVGLPVQSLLYGLYPDLH